mmetsp:Transcript_102422/g.181896  ORF Transcript_102422/g.181896 Transcript_102422/m.181896 type:complete len:225 (-) Transcript_102422:70-744(-)|eukprot:CAMPEP_0197665448 /NCGR_PEP_ID=MMETSP1338-20131121/59232_1 /TAXON_ID=43686 ORGANISM="Pelagodinium beii, Strain RCC1491" /NCGR_SAMPLE_ID=MMETSP1338 /ASSEMBLY_ACC=CAM_ASM_000754 /LENGTH=224 /DNA_ID=CAMNT_0043244253 /DNA_START=38 /DNA_END=712 /DNA_ORIENTATION=+
MSSRSMFIAAGRRLQPNTGCCTAFAAARQKVAFKPVLTAIGRRGRPISEPALVHFRSFSTEEQVPSVEELDTKIEEAKELLKELEDKLKASKADLQQATKRHQGDLDNETKYGYTKFALSLLHIPDNLERAIDSVKADDLDESEELRKEIETVKTIKGNVEEALAKFGVVKMKALDDTFDPAKHEAMFAMPMPGKEPNVIFHVMEPGYTIYDRTLRAAKVGITK